MYDSPDHGVHSASESGTSRDLLYSCQFTKGGGCGLESVSIWKVAFQSQIVVACMQTVININAAGK